MVMLIIRRGVLGTLVLKATKLSSSAHSIYYSSSSSSSLSSSAPKSSPPVSSSKSTAGIVATGSAADVTGNEILLGDDTTAAAKAATIPSLLQPRVVVYDGVCHLCHKGVKWVIEADKDRKIKFCCLQSRAAEPYITLSGRDRQDVLRRFLFVEGPHLYHQGSTAALKVLSYLPLPYSALSTLLIVPTPLRDAVYDYIAKRRYDWFGKEDDCLVLQEKELLERFIDREELMDRSRPDL